MDLSIKCFLLLACVFAVVFAQGATTEESVLPECPVPDPPMGAYFPDPTDCRYFYHCSNGVPIRLKCAPGTVFNATISACDSSDLSCIPSE